MSTKIGLISDIHSTTAPLREALDIFSRESVDTIICAGDIAGYGNDEIEQTIEILQNNHCLCIAGNHDLLDDNDELKASKSNASFFKQLPKKLDLNIENKTLFVVHASPLDAMHGGIKLLSPEGHVLKNRKIYWEEQLQEFTYDILIVGHTHQVFSEYINNTLVINPGSTTFNHTCSILTLPEMQIKTFPLSGKQPILCWNWGMFYQQCNNN